MTDEELVDVSDSGSEILLLSPTSVSLKPAKEINKHAVRDFIELGKDSETCSDFSLMKHCHRSLGKAVTFVTKVCSFFILPF